MKTVPKPKFIDDPKSIQYKAFIVFERMLTKNFFALSPDAYNKLVYEVSSMYGLFYEYQHSSEKIEKYDHETISELTNQIQELQS